MGYIYGVKSKKLCCDCCSKEGARKRACPCGYCPSAALCSECNKAVRNDGRWLAAHKNCQKHSDEFKARNAREKELKDSGVYVRCSALSVGILVHALFENGNGEVIGKMMAHSTYDSIPLLEVATVADYEKFGIVTDAPEKFDFSATKDIETEKCIKFFNDVHASMKGTTSHEN